MSLHITFDVEMYQCGKCINAGKCTTRGMYPCRHGRQIAAPTSIINR